MIDYSLIVKTADSEMKQQTRSIFRDIINSKFFDIEVLHVVHG